MDAKATSYLDAGRLVDDDLELVLTRTHPGDPARGLVPQFEFEMRLANTGTPVGSVHFRLGLTEKLKCFGGSLGYAVDEAHRGHRYAARACKLLFPLARKYGLREVWITCSPDNAASRRTCALMGAAYVDTIEAEEPRALTLNPSLHRSLQSLQSLQSLPSFHLVPTVLRGDAWRGRPARIGT